MGLGASVRVGALIIRSLLVPAIMHVIGPANWAMPAWLDHILPKLSVEADQNPQESPKPTTLWACRDDNFSSRWGDGDAGSDPGHDLIPKQLPSRGQVVAVTAALEDIQVHQRRTRILRR